MRQRPKPHSTHLRRRWCWLLLPLLLAIPAAVALSEAGAPPQDDRVANWVPVSSLPDRASYVLILDRCEELAVELHIHYRVQRSDPSWGGQFLAFLNGNPRGDAERRILALELELRGWNPRYDLKPDSLVVISGGSAALELIRFEGRGGVPWIVPKRSKYLYAFQVAQAQDVGNIAHLQLRGSDCEVPPLALQPLHTYQAGASSMAPPDL